MQDQNYAIAVYKHIFVSIVLISTRDHKHVPIEQSGESETDSIQLAYNLDSN